MNGERVFFFHLKHKACLLIVFGWWVAFCIFGRINLKSLLDGVECCGLLSEVWDGE